MKDMELVIILVAVGLYIVYKIYQYVASSEERNIKKQILQARKVEWELFKEVFGDDFNIDSEKFRTLDKLKKVLPQSYKCKHRKCNGVMLKLIIKDPRSYYEGSYYQCSVCGRPKFTIHNKGLLEWEMLETQGNN